jgi:plastocyanin
MVEAAADVEASNATANATDADAVAADAEADDTTANQTQTSSSSIQLDNTTTSGGNISILSQSNDHKVSIVPGSSFLADKAYSPNPVEVKAGQRVTWTNDDLVQHTVTSGSPGAMDFGKSFDSGLVRLLNKAMTFEYTFATSGEYPYYCQLHPTMIGTVSVK